MYSTKHLNNQQLAFKEACENRFAAFVKGVAPWLVLGHIHYDVCDWIQDNYEKGVKHQLILLPRAHLKSTLVALWVAWKIVKNPAITILYASASHTLAELQVSFIKTILGGDTMCFYWPELLHPESGKRKVWRQTEITVDHPIREEQGVRDYTIRAMAIGHGATGLHCDMMVFDDVVAPEAEQHSPWTSEGRQKLATWSSFMSSVLNSNGEKIVVGTRYHAKDLYNDYINSEVDVFDINGEPLSKEPGYEVMIKVVEENGNFLWPRQQGPKGRWEGFDWVVLNRKRAGYLDKAKFYSQYYQNPIDPETAHYVDSFNYYDKDKLVYDRNNWYIQLGTGQRRVLNVYTALDAASTINKDSDYTAIVVIGIDYENNRYILDIDRFKTDRLSVIEEHVFILFLKWRFRRLRVETVAAQKFIYTQIRDAMRKRNIFFNIDEYKPSPRGGNKKERIRAILEPLYKNGQMFHYRGGNCEVLEEELVLEHAPHDDIADATAIVNEMAERPAVAKIASDSNENNTIKFNARFGGVN